MSRTRLRDDMADEAEEEAAGAAAAREDAAASVPSGRERLAAVDGLLEGFAARAAAHDEADSFVSENVAELRAARFYSAGVPVARGGGGVSHAEMVACVRRMARACPATALTAAMHQHVVFASVYNDMRGSGGGALLERVAATEAVLVSTGAGDWLWSSGELRPAQGGYSFTARKAFASGCEAGQVLVTSGRLGDEVLHFGVPLDAPGVSVDGDWVTLGMRGTGSHTVTLRDVFVPEGSVTLRRPAGAWHPAWSVIATVALPLIMAAYAGLCDAAVDLAVAASRSVAAGGSDALALRLGELRLAHAGVDATLGALLANAEELRFEPTPERAETAFAYKSLAARSVRATLDQALALTGGRGYFRRNAIERLLRDSYGAGLHPLPEHEQKLFSGRLLLGLPPVASPADAMDG